MKSILTQIVAKAVEKILKNFEEGGLADIRIPFIPPTERNLYFDYY